MKKRQLHSIILLINFLLLNSIISFSQFDNFKFDYFTTDNGLSQNRVNSILRDSKGYLWIGTDRGLNKFDGQKNIFYKSDALQPNSISANIITCIFEDHLNNLWIGTLNDGLNLYDRQTETFTHYKAGAADSISNNTICSILEDTKGDLWISTAHGLNKWERKQNRFLRFYVPAIEKKENSNYIRDIAIDAKGNIWFISFGLELWRFDTQSYQFKKISDLPLNPTDFSTRSIVIGQDGIIWMGIEGNGLSSFNPQTEQLKYFNYKGDGQGTNDRLIKDLYIDEDRYLYIATDIGGINRLDLQSMRFEYNKKEEKRQTSLNSNSIWVIYLDKEGILYAGTSASGVNIHNPKKERFITYKHNPHDKNSLIFDVVFRFFEDSQGFIWIGTDGGGVSIFDPKNKTFKNYQHNPSDPYSISGNAVLSFAEDKNNDVWIGTWGAGLNRYDRKTGKFHHYMPNPNNPHAISSPNVWELFADANDNIWISIFDVGVDVYNIKRGVIKKFRPNATVSGNFIKLNTNSIVRQKNGTIGFISRNGYFTLDTVSLELREDKRFEKYNLQDLCIDIKGNYWIGTRDKGLLLMKPDGTIETPDKSNGFPTDYTSGILEDNKGNIWILTDFGLSEFSVKTRKTRNFTVADGLQGKQFNKYAHLVAKDGTIYVGGYNGFNTFKPEDIKLNTYIPPVYINEFQIFNEPVSVSTPNSPLKHTISETKEIVLSYKQSVFSFGFTAINFTYPEKTLYAYKMEGYDKKWNYTNSLRRFATYTNLDAGEYIFMVKATNNDEVWNETPATIKITIIPPFWRTWWFKVVLIIFLIVIIILIYYIRVRQIKRHNEILKILVEKKTKELKEQNIEIEKKNKILTEQTIKLNENNALLEERQTQIEKQSEELLSQKEELLTQKEELETQRDVLSEINATKDKLFSVLAHDLRSPFNTIIGYSDLLYNKLESYPMEKIKSQIGYIRDGARDTYGLLNNLLEWSRSQRGAISCEFEKLNLKECLDSELKILKQQASRKEIEIETHISGFEKAIIADINLLQTVIRNLISNAIKFSKTGDTIWIIIEYLPNEVIFSVKDHGTGMPQDVIEKLFSISGNVSKRGTAGEKGSGLGLLLCADFIEKQNGKIWVKSKENEGSTFSFSLPLSNE